jgi:L-ascorbate metabolism protein UlaG (beta-lactamase superfamily)
MMSLTQIATIAAMFGAVVLSAAEHEPPPRDELATEAGPLVIHPIEHATFVMEWDGRTIAVDPVGGAELFAAFAKPDLVLITHIHGDHLSVETVQALRGAATAIIAPESVAEKFSEDERGAITVLANGEATDWKGVRIAAVPAYNTTPERLGFHPEGRDNGYLLDLAGTRVYISGDTEGHAAMRALEDVDAAFVCMNLPYTMDVAAAADAVLAFAPKLVYPYHFRGKDGMSDLDEFRRLVAAKPDIVVRVLDWY